MDYKKFLISFIAFMIALWGGGLLFNYALAGALGAAYATGLWGFGISSFVAFLVYLAVLKLYKDADPT